MSRWWGLGRGGSKQREDKNELSCSCQDPGSSGLPVCSLLVHVLACLLAGCELKGRNYVLFTTAPPHLSAPCPVRSSANTGPSDSFLISFGSCQPLHLWCFPFQPVHDVKLIRPDAEEKVTAVLDSPWVSVPAWSPGPRCDSWGRWRLGQIPPSKQGHERVDECVCVYTYRQLEERVSSV